MRDFSQTIILGNVGNDPELKYTANGTAVTNFSVATNERWKDKESGEQKEKTEWHRVVAFGQVAEFVCEYVNKGSRVLVQGKNETRKWADKEGVERYTTEIKATSVDTQDRREATQESDTPKAAVRKPAAAARPAARPAAKPAGRPGVRPPVAMLYEPEEEAPWNDELLVR